MGLDTPGRFSAIFNMGDNFCDFLFGFLHTNPLLKRVHSNRKEFAPKGSKLFPFRVDSFSEGSKENFDTVISLENVLIPLNSVSYQPSLKMY